MSRKHTDAELLEEITRVRDLLGRAPKAQDMTEHSKFSLNSYKRAFGGITNALLKIGEKPTFIRNQTKEDVISELQRLCKELGRIPTVNEFSKLSSMSFVTMRKIAQYQSWHSLLKEAGISDDEMIHLKKHNVTNEELKEEILRLKNKIGRYPTYNEMSIEGKYSCNTYEQKFGSWSKAFIALGFDDYEPQSIYKNQIRTIGKDGYTYRSHFEARGANILYELVMNDKIIQYEYERKVCNNRPWTCDFVVTANDGQEYWIEFDGMMESRKEIYDDNHEKIRYYKDNNIKYIIITDEDNLEEKLNEKSFK